VYNTLDRHGIKTYADEDSRSMVNVSFNFNDPDWTVAFLSWTAAQGFMGLEGHRSIGGIRASLYNGVSDLAVEHLCGAIDRFVCRKQGA
jgi:phosphoserine aminotransferase